MENNYHAIEASSEEELLREVKDIEQAARTIIRNAELESARIIAAAEAQVKTQQADELAVWHATDQAALTAFRQALEDQVQVINREEQARAQAWRAKADANLERAVDYVLRLVLSQPER